LHSGSGWLMWTDSRIVSPVSFYIYGPGGVPVEQINNSTGVVTYLHHDQAGSTRLITGSTVRPKAHTPTTPTATQPGTPALPPRRSATTGNTPAPTRA
jgi:hypothetical protein